MSRTGTPWVDISEYSFINDPILLPQGKESEMNNGPPFILKLTLDQEVSSLSLGQLVFEVERSATVKTLINAIAGKVKAILGNRGIVLNNPCRIGIKRAPGDDGNVCFVATVTLNPKPDDQPGLGPSTSPRPVHPSSRLPKRRMPKLAAAQFFTQLEEKGRT
ncbi:uncharacterized protein DFL_003874 [Arthrobotrys flagrans]|uniref:Uncharacterized protein n=1 Tax=Arthrobotrys flagrans TaxID=97331 RepID=A0A437A383_ARTFL|nr:hypothetical protein DFL_003874 [Arthrobotrys flagrans]